MKHFAPVLLVLLLLVLAVPAFAAEADLAVSAKEAQPGQTVTVPVMLSANPGLVSLTVEVSFDEGMFALIGVSDSGLLPGAMHSTGYGSPYRLNWVNDTSRIDFTAAGTLAILTFSVRQDAKPGEYPLSLSVPQDGVLNTDVENVPYTLTSGKITVAGMTPEQPNQPSKSDPDQPETKEEPEKQGSAPERDPDPEPKPESTDESAPAKNSDERKPEPQPETADRWENPFRDVPETADYYDAVRFVYECGLFNGVSATEFAPETTMTRAMFVTVLGRLERVDGTQFTVPSPFADVVGGSWYAPYVAWAEQNGIVKGYSAVKFGVNDPVTVEQAVVFAARFAEFRGIDISGAPPLTGYEDAAAVSDWAAAQMRWAAACGIYRGSDGMLEPQSPAPRRLVAEMMAALAMLLEG